MALFKIGPDDCQHARWCRAKKDGEHAADCPTRLRLTDADVNGFCALYVSESTLAISDPTPWGPHVSFHTSIRGAYDGRTASASDNSPGMRRWLAEDLIAHAKAGSER